MARKGGFTIIELLLAVSIMALLGGLSFPYITAFQTRNNLDLSANTLAQTYRRAQTLAMASQADASWGVHVASPNITLYKGTSFASRDTDFDEIYQVNDGISVSGNTEVNFSKVFGTPSATGMITISVNGDSRNVSINEKGIVNY